MHLIDKPDSAPEPDVDFETFRKIDIRIGTIIEAAPLEGARKPALKLLIDFGAGVGQLKSSAQITQHYAPDELVGRQVAAVVNFPPRQIGKFMSQCLTLGFADQDGAIVLISADQAVPNGARLA
ncbi:MAG: tRNA-binding protein [Pseudomonadota bacterium]